MAFFFENYNSMDAQDLQKLIKVMWPVLTPIIDRWTYNVPGGMAGSLIQRVKAGKYAKELAGPIPPDRSTTCSVPGCSDLVWTSNPACFMYKRADKSKDRFIHDSVQHPPAPCCAYVCYNHRAVSCTLPEHVPRQKASSDQKLSKSFDKKLKKIIKAAELNQEGRYVSRMVRFGIKIPLTIPEEP